MDNFLICEICKIKYDDHQRLPLILSCSHTICQKCIENLRRGKINKCPKCNQDVQLVKRKMSQFTLNERILQMIKQNNKNQLLDKNKRPNIKEMDKDSSEYFSSSNSGMFSGTNQEETEEEEEEEESEEGSNEECNEFIEEEEESQSNSIQSKITEKAETDFCIRHKDKLIEYFCTDCTQPVCVNCIFFMHNGHKLTNLNEMSNIIKYNISDFTKILTKLQKVNQENVLTAKLKREELQQLKEKQINILNKTFEEIEEYLEDKRNELMKEFDYKYSLELKRFVKLNNLLKTTVNETNKIKEVSEQLEMFLDNHSDATVLKKIDEFTMFLHRSYMDIKRLYKTEISIKAEMKIDPNMRPIETYNKNIISLIKAIDPKVVCYSIEKSDNPKESGNDNNKILEGLVDKIVKNKKNFGIEDKNSSYTNSPQNVQIFQRKNRGRSAKETYLEFNKHFDNSRLNKIPEESGNTNAEEENLNSPSTSENFIRRTNKLRKDTRENSYSSKFNSIIMNENKKSYLNLRDKMRNLSSKYEENFIKEDKKEDPKLNHLEKFNSNKEFKVTRKGIIEAKSGIHSNEEQSEYSNNSKKTNAQLPKIPVKFNKEPKQREDNEWSNKISLKNENNWTNHNDNNKNYTNTTSPYIICVGDTNYFLKYLIDNNTWECIKIENKSSNKENGYEKLRYSSLVSISMNKLILTGGCNVSSEEASCICQEIFLHKDSKENITIKRLKNMNRSRYAHSSIFIKEYIYVCGGFDHKDDHKTNPSTLKSCEKFSISDNKWTNIANLNTARAFFGICCLNQENIFAFGGFSDEQLLNTIEKYDIITDTWISYFLRLPEKLAKMGVINYNDKNILIIGGIDSNYEIVDGVFELDLMINKFIKLKDMNYARSFNQSAFLYKNFVYVIGNNIESNCEKYDCDKDKWEMIESYSGVIKNSSLNELYNFCFALSSDMRENE